MTISDEAQLLGSGVIRGLNQIVNPAMAGLSAWLTKDESAISLTNSSVEFTPYKFEEMLSWLSFDICRFSRASSESTRQCRSNCGEIAWNSVKAYYAGLYSCSAICRIIGRFLMFLDEREASAINARISANGVSFKVRSLMEVNISQRAISLRPVNGNSHEAIWRCFSSSMNSISRSSSKSVIALRNPTALLNLNEIARVAWSPSGKATLSEIRNKINYRHNYDCWFPSFSKEQRAIFRSPVTNLQPFDTNFPLRSLYSSCGFIHLMQIDLINILAGRNAVGRDQLFYVLQSEWLNTSRRWTA